MEIQNTIDYTSRGIFDKSKLKLVSKDISPSQTGVYLLEDEYISKYFSKYVKDTDVWLSCASTVDAALRSTKPSSDFHTTRVSGWYALDPETSVNDNIINAYNTLLDAIRDKQKEILGEWPLLEDIEKWNEFSELRADFEAIKKLRDKKCK